MLKSLEDVSKYRFPYVTIVRDAANNRVYHFGESKLYLGLVGEYLGIICVMQTERRSTLLVPTKVFETRKRFALPFDSGFKPESYRGLTIILDSYQIAKEVFGHSRFTKVNLERDQNPDPFYLYSLVEPGRDDLTTICLDFSIYKK